jgi:hypothetical protein
MAPGGSEHPTNRRNGRSILASGRPERVAQVRTRRTAPPNQPAADPIIASGLPPTRPNESANSFGFNRRVFQHNRRKRSLRCRRTISPSTYLMTTDRTLGLAKRIPAARVTGAGCQEGAHHRGSEPVYSAYNFIRMGYRRFSPDNFGAWPNTLYWRKDVK